MKTSIGTETEATGSVDKTSILSGAHLKVPNALTKRHQRSIESQHH